MKRKSYTVDFKTRVALSAIRGLRTISEIASEFEIHPNLVSLWKKQALDNLPDVFKSTAKTKKDNSSELTSRLYQQIGQLQVELDWLKKKTGFDSWRAQTGGTGTRWNITKPAMSASWNQPIQSLLSAQRREFFESHADESDWSSVHENSILWYS